MAFGFDIDPLIGYMNQYVTQWMDLIYAIGGIAIGAFALMKLKKFLS